MWPEILLGHVDGHRVAQGGVGLRRRHHGERLLEKLVERAGKASEHVVQVGSREPASLKVCAFVVKQRERPADVTVHYVGREIPDVFVVGYGLDAQEQYRNLPYLARLA